MYSEHTVWCHPSKRLFCLNHFLSLNHVQLPVLLCETLLKDYLRHPHWTENRGFVCFLPSVFRLVSVESWAERAEKKWKNIPREWVRKLARTHSDLFLAPNGKRHTTWSDPDSLQSNAVDAAMGLLHCHSGLVICPTPKCRGIVDRFACGRRRLLCNPNLLLPSSVVVWC